MTGGRVASIWRYPIKGFTPERLSSARLKPVAGIAFDRLYAVENGPSGFDPQAPTHISKAKFTVLAHIPEIAQIHTRFEETNGFLHAAYRGGAPIAVNLEEATGRAAFADWLAQNLGERVRSPLRVLKGPGAHRFYDAQRGHLSLINLASVRDLEERLERPVDPLRFRANVYVDGWPAWREMDAVNGTLELGGVKARVIDTIIRCAATHVDPATGVRDLDMLAALYQQYGHRYCGLYVQVETAGEIFAGDRADLSG